MCARFVYSWVMRRCVTCNARMRRYLKTSTGVGFGGNKSEIEIFGGGKTNNVMSPFGFYVQWPYHPPFPPAMCVIARDYWFRRANHKYDSQLQVDIARTSCSSSASLTNSRYCTLNRVAFLIVLSLIIPRAASHAKLRMTRTW